LGNETPFSTSFLPYIWIGECPRARYKYIKHNSKVEGCGRNMMEEIGAVEVISAYLEYSENIHFP
jgi:hypothetical protein